MSGNDDNYSKEKLHEIIYPSAKFNWVNLRKMISLYTERLEDFLVYNEFREEEDTRNLLLIQSLRNRNLRKILGPLIENTIGKARKRKVRSYDDYAYLLKLQGDEYSFTSDKIKGEGKMEWYKDQMKKFAEVTELNIVASTLSMMQLVHYYNVSDESIDQDVFLKDEVLKRMESPGGLNYREEYHYIYAKYLIVKIILNRSDKQCYKDALEYITKYSEKFTEDFCYYSMISLYVLATDQVTYGYKDFSHILVEIYRAIDSSGAISRQRVLYYIFLMEITNACIYCGETALAENMIEKYSGFIDSDLRTDSVNACRAQIHFSRKEYAESLGCLTKVGYDTFFLYMEAKILQCKIYYILKDFEGLYPVIDSVSQYFRRAKDLPSKEEVISYRYFFTYFKKMIRLAANGSKEDFLFFKKTAGEQNYYNRDWLNEEIRKISEKI